MDATIRSLVKWVASLGLTQYSDQYGNTCFGDDTQKHLFHVHEHTTKVDIEPRSAEQYNFLKERYGLDAHGWYKDVWLELDTKDYPIEKIKEILLLVIKSETPK